MPSRLITPGSSARQRWRMPRLRAACAVACHGTNLTLTAGGRAANEARACGTYAPLPGLQAAGGQTARLSDSIAPRRQGHLQVKRKISRTASLYERQRTYLESALHCGYCFPFLPLLTLCTFLRLNRRNISNVMAVSKPANKRFPITAAIGIPKAESSPAIASGAIKAPARLLSCFGMSCIWKSLTNRLRGGAAKQRRPS